jgi:hypothetical protein
VGIRCTDHIEPLYPQKLVLTSPTSSDRSVGIVCSWTLPILSKKALLHKSLISDGKIGLTWRISGYEEHVAVKKKF